MEEKKLKKKLLILVAAIVLIVGVMSGCVEETATENTAPEAVISITQAGLTITYDASGSTDADDDDLTYAWDFGDEVGNDTEATGTYTYAASGDYTVTLTVNDGTVDSEEATEALTITNPPTVEITVPENITNSTAATFTATATKGDVNISDPGYAWYVDDVLQEGMNTTTFEYTFTSVGDFVVKVVVTDELDLTGEASETVTVIEATE